ncbi:MAG: cobalamin-binding protein [Betaproteobacteria bacterium]|nr:cobalamin-binding protein [Betaproteobacteria bacterium]
MAAVIALRRCASSPCRAGAQAGRGIGGWRRLGSSLLAAAGLAVASLPVRAEVHVVDDTGASVVLAQPARRIVTLAPHATELVFAAGAGERVVGVIKGSDYPPAATKLPVVGDVAALDLERIVALAPDLIVTWPWTTPAQVSWLRDHGIPVFETDARHIDDIASDIERLGVLAGTKASADAAAARFRAKVDALARSAGGSPRLRVFYQVYDAPIYTLGGEQLVTQAIERCGGTNVFGAQPVPALQVSVEAVLAADPQVIVAGTDGARRPAWLDRWRRWKALAAVRLGNLFVVDANLLHRPGPRFVDGMASLCAALAGAQRPKRDGL